MSAMDWLTWPITTTAKYAVNGVSYALDLSKGVFNFGYSAVTHERSRSVFTQLTSILVKDILPIVLMNQAQEFAQDEINDYYQDDSTQPLKVLLWGASLSLTVVHFLATTNRKLDAMVKTGVLRLEAPSVFSEGSSNSSLALCSADNAECQKAGFRYGLSSTIGFYALQGSLYGIKYASGGWVNTAAEALMQWQMANFIMEQAMPEVCNHHLNEFKTSGLPVVIMGAEWGLSHCSTQFLEQWTGVPSSVSHKLLNDFFFLTMIGAVSHMSKAPPTAGHITFPDPLYALESGMIWLVDVFVLGLTKKVPEMLKNKQSVVPWALLKDYTVLALNHPITQSTMKWMIPNYLLTPEAFVHEPVIAQHWPGVQKKVESLILYVKEQEKRRVVTYSRPLPDSLKANALKFKFKIPKFVTHAALFLLENPTGRGVLENFRIQVAQLVIFDEHTRVITAKGEQLSSTQKTLTDSDDGACLEESDVVKTKALSLTAAVGLFSNKGALTSDNMLASLDQEARQLVIETDDETDSKRLNTENMFDNF